ncbi:HAD-IC family P-type ATPase [Streptomyces sp. NPDC002896]|uniref:HAD-IC family P-type ATPase n=1 Tax=Streptomyces sp. NPDC002896 TaxID=3154438 RepID=UPI003320A52D
MSDALSGLPRALADVFAVLGDAGQERSRRRVWSGGGRAHIEVRGLSGLGERHDRLVCALGMALRAVEGVRWAEVNAVLGQVVVDADEDDVGLDRLVELVEQVEKAHGSDGETFAGHRAHPPFDTAPAVLAGASLAADCLGLVVTGLSRVTPWSAPVLLRVPVVLAETQPRLRRLLEERLGRAHAEMVLGVAHAAVNSLTRGTAPLALDAVQRLWQLAEIRSRQAVWSWRESELVGAGDGLPRHVPERVRRPAPLPDGPVEACGQRTSLAALLGSGGVLAWTGSPEQAAQAILATVPKAAGIGREAFCTRLGRDLARDGVVAMDGTALRLLDRVSTVLIDSTVLCEPRPRLLSAVATGRLDEADVWRAGQSALLGRSLQDLWGPGPWVCEGWRLERPADAPHGRPDAPSGLPLDLRDTRGRRQGRILVGCELDPLADALLGTARSGSRRLLLTEHVSADELLPWADQAVPMSASLPEEVRRLQEDGQVVLLLTSAEDEALAAADVGVTVLPGPGGAGRVCWSAHLISGPGLAQAWRVLAALDEAHQVSSRSARLCLGGSALGALIAAARTRRSVVGLTTSPVHVAAFLAQSGGVRAARRLARRPLPPARIRSAWHALEAPEIFGIVGGAGDGPGGRPTAGSSAESGRTKRGALAAAVHTVAGAAGLTGAVRGAAQLVTAVREELRDPLTPVLALGAAASAAVGSGVDSALVGGVMAGNAVVSGVQRLSAERALNGLLLAEQQFARRVHWTPVASTADPDPSRFFAGLQTAPVHTTAAQDLRLGDIIALRPSDVVPADARLLVGDRLEIDEATMTGESVPVAKDPAATPGAELAERSCMVYQGCTVLAGTGYAVVVATGAQTEAGRAADLAGTATTPPGIESHLAALTKAALPAVGIGGAAVTVLGLLRGVPVREALASGVAIAVAAVPEGLPLVATVAQSAAARRLSRHGILTRSARVLEALGRVDVVCFDKTGTLTQGRLTVTGLATPDHELRMDSPTGRRLLQIAARACPTPKDGQTLTHATDQAVIDAATTHCEPDRTWRSVTELPFEASRGYSACLGTESGHPCLAVKGAPETVLARCTATLSTSHEPGSDTTLSTSHEPGSDGTVPLTPTRRRAAHRLMQRLAASGLRVLAVAEARPSSPADPGDDVADLAHDLTLLGFLAIADPARPGAAETVKRLAEAGVRTVMITGDHPATAAAVARELGIPDADSVLTGAELDTLSERARLRRIAQTAVFARVSPEHKVRIVQALQRTGHVVAMTGDGVNDAAAIRLADVGIGLAAHGSTSARAAADLVLTDPDPTRLLQALAEGRTLWHSVRDAVAILVGGNAGEVAFTVLGTALTGRAPLGTRQLLLVNLLTDMLPALAVALAPARATKPGEDPLTGGPVPSLLGRDLAHVLAVRGTATTLGAATAWQIGRFTGLQRRASTMGLAALVGTQLGQTLITDWHSPLVLATAGLSTAALVAVVQIPGISHFFGCTPLGPVAWTTVTACSAASTLAAAFAPRILGLQPTATST